MCFCHHTRHGLEGSPSNALILPFPVLKSYASVSYKHPRAEEVSEGLYSQAFLLFLWSRAHQDAQTGLEIVILQPQCSQ